MKTVKKKVLFQVREFECAKCGWKWIPRVPNPKKCPGCQQPLRLAEEKTK